MIVLGDDGLPVGRRKKGNYINIGGVLHKRCSHCGEYLRLGYFHALKYTRDGVKHESLQSWCKLCMTTENCKRVKENKEREMA